MIEMSFLWEINYCIFIHSLKYLLLFGSSYMAATKTLYNLSIITVYYINTNETPGELLCKNISSRVKITCYLHM